MYSIVIIVCVILALWYCIEVSILHRGLTTLPVSGNPDNLTFSIIIAARNEEKNIAHCLDSILKQNVSQSRYEIIIVDDRSEDKTSEIVKEYIKTGIPVKLLTVKSVPPGIAPKKNAIIQGIKSASKEVVVFTDADCRVPPSWLDTIDRCFTPETGLVQGITSYYFLTGMNKFFFGLQAVDFLSHNIVSAAGIGAGLPINSNANNMAFRKRVFLEIGGYGMGNQKVVSGDDDLLLQKVWKSRVWKVNFMSDPDGAVTTAPTPTVADVFEQRKRWGSKTIHYSFSQILFLTGIFLFYCAIGLTFVLSFFEKNYFIAFAVLFFIKLFGELLIMVPGTNIFGKKELRKYLIIASFLQLPVVLSAVILGTFGTFSWKGDTFRRRIKSISA